MEIGFALVANERRKGYGTEAIQLMIDHLFLTKDVVRIQVSTDTSNIASQRALEKVGFSKEGTMRKSWYTRGETETIIFTAFSEKSGKSQER